MKLYLAALLILALITTVWYFFLRKKKEHYTEIASCEGTDKEFTLIIFTMEGCGHCENFKPEWKKFVAQTSNQPWSKKVCTAEMTAEDAETSQKYQITGFPTVILVNNKTAKRTVFDGSRTVQGLNQFVATHV